MQYTEITIGDFERFVKDEMKGAFKEITSQLPMNIHERVWEYPMNDKLSIRIFSSINRSKSRGRGEDAIRVVVWNTHANRMQAGSKRVNRTEGALVRMRERAAELYKKWVSADISCNVCGTGSLVLRKGGKDKKEFYGCSNYPNCKHTQSQI